MICLFVRGGKYYLLVLVMSVLFLVKTNAQQASFPLGKHFFLQFEQQLNSLNNAHTSFKPLKRSLLKPSAIQLPLFNDKPNLKNWLKRKLLTEHLFIFKGNDYRVIASQIINFSKGKEIITKQGTYINTRGFLIEGELGEGLSFFSSFTENQAVFPAYIHTYILNHKVVPGQGYARSFKKNGFDYAMSSGHVTIQVLKNSIIQFGHGKHFIGDGYRSLLLSDNAFNYPYLKVQTTFDCWQYTNLYAEFQDINSFLVNDSYDNMGYAKKYMSAHYLSINVSDQLNLALYQTVIVNKEGEHGFLNGNYLNPLSLLLNTEFNKVTSEHLLLGTTAKYKLPFNAYIYAQTVFSGFSENNWKFDWWQNRFGYQLGCKIFNFFGVENLTLQAEYNFVRPYTYAHDNPQQNYAHYNQPLAHPLGANFAEFLVLSTYKWKRWEIDAKLISAQYGDEIKGESTSYGNDLFMSTGDYADQGAVGSGRPSDFGIKIFQGSLTTVNLKMFNLAYIINPKTNLKINLGITLRDLESEESKMQTQFIDFGIFSDLFNHYYDI